MDYLFFGFDMKTTRATASAIVCAITPGAYHYSLQPRDRFSKRYLSY